MRPVKNKMGRDPCCDKDSVKRGPWSAEEDAKLKEYIEKNGTGGNWIAFPQRAGLGRCEKSCRLRWLNYLRPNIKHGNFSEEEDRIICNLYASIGSRWSIIAARLPGRTDNDIKNYWNTKLKKKIMAMDMGSTITAHKNSYPHQTIFSSLLQTASSTTSSSCFSSYLSYNCNSHTYESMQTANSITGLEQLLNSTSCLLGNMSSPTTANSAINSQETFKSPVQGHLVKGSALKGEASCSSSDGSTINNSDEVSHGKEPEYEFRNGAETDTIQKYICSDGVQDTQKSMAPNCDNLDGKDNKSTESWQDNYPFDFGLEDIKQLISTSSCNSSFLYDDHNMD